MIDWMVACSGARMRILYTELCLDLTKLGVHFTYVPNFSSMQSITRRRGRLICAVNKHGNLLFGPSMWVHMGTVQVYFGLWNPRLYRGERNEKVAEMVFEILHRQPFREPQPTTKSQAFIRKYGLVEMEPG